MSKTMTLRPETALGAALALGLLWSGTSFAHNHQHHDAPAATAPALPAAAAFAPAAPGADLVWLSETPPMTRKAKPEPGQEQGSVESAVAEGGERLMNHDGAKHLWLRRGGDPMRAQAVPADSISLPLRLLDGQGGIQTLVPIADGGRFHVQASLEEMGFYNAYLTQAAVVDGRLQAMVAKAEMLKGTCCKKGIEDGQDKALSDPSQPIELVREHKPDEKLFTRIVSGDTILFTVFSFGKPLPGAAVTLATQQGWRKTVVSDAEGRARFTLIRDYFPAWDDFRRQTKQTFLVSAEAEAAGPGQWQGQDYAAAVLRTTLAGRYAPSPHDYRSYAFGLGISLGTIVFLGTAVYLYRRRRVKPFQEVRFDGKA